MWSAVASFLSALTPSNPRHTDARAVAQQSEQLKGSERKKDELNALHLMEKRLGFLDRKKKNKNKKHLFTFLSQCT